MPLMWAHAEYLKLLRSIADGRVVDLISPVAERYLAGRGRHDLEIWKPTRPARAVGPGQVLRVQGPAAFVLQWTADEWRTVVRTHSTPTRLGVEFVDVAVGAGQSAPIRFTFFWTAGQRWEGRDYVVQTDRSFLTISPAD